MKMTNSPRTATKSETTLVGCLVAAGLVVGLIQSITWVSRAGWDTVSYLDLADLIRRGNFHEALSPYWSPLYPVIIAVAKTFAPALKSERTVICVLQYIFLMLYLGASYRFWSAVLKAQSRLSNEEETTRLPRLPQIALMGSLTLLSCLAVGDVAVKGPDMLSAAIYLTANALIVTCLYQTPSVARAARIGCFMGLAYLAKAFFVSWVFPCVALLAVFRKDYNLTWKHLIALTISMLTTMALYVVPLSLKLGHLSFGESGKYQIVFSSNEHILPMVPMVHGSIRTKHPAAILFKTPVVYEFEKPFDVSYPPWFDPDYWNDGIDLKIDWKRYDELLVDKIVSLFFSFVFFLSVLKIGLSFSARKLVPYSIQELKKTSPVWLTACACSSLYLFMSAAVSRYFMGFIPTMAAAIFLAYKSPDTEPVSKRERRFLWFVTALVLVAFTLKSLMHVYFFLPKLAEKNSHDAHSAIVQKLEELGIKPHDKIMRVAPNEGGEYYWAHLADIRVVAECASPGEFLSMSATNGNKLDAILRSKKIKAIVLDRTNRKPDEPAPAPTGAAWQNVPGTKTFIRLVPQ
jgi:hypothetical protein